MALKIPVPAGVTIVVKSGQEVDFNTPLYKKTLKRNVSIPIAKILDIKPDKIFFSLKRVVGDEINKGEILAVKKTLLKEQKYYSEYTGVIKEVNHENGTVIVTTQSADEESLNSFFKGTIDEVGKEEIEIKLDKVKDCDVLESSKDFGGSVFYVKTDDINELETEKIDSKILIIKKVASFNQVRLEVMGVKGFVTQEGLDQNPSVDYARIKVKDWEEIVKANLPYCLVIGSKIYFYA